MIRLSGAVKRCTICKCDALEREESLNALKCLACGELFEIREGILNFMRELDDYTENYDLICKDDLTAPKTPSEVKQIFTALAKWRARGRVCDVGCGDGYVITKIDSPDRIAVDIAFGYLSRIPSALTRIWCRAENMPLQTNSIDTVVCTDLIEHVLDAKCLAMELDRVVKLDGAVLLAFPFEQDLSVYNLPAYKAKYGKYKYVHLRSINDALIAELFPAYTVAFSHLITEGMEFMEFKPYPIKFIELRRRN
jgi:ubiquinone/menaquinone biosynthesis C-methylase UbiE